MSNQHIATKGTPLSAREKEVAELYVQGLMPHQIGMRLFLSPSTISTHLTHIQQKLGIENPRKLLIHLIREKVLAEAKAKNITDVPLEMLG